MYLQVLKVKILSACSLFPNETVIYIILAFFLVVWHLTSPVTLQGGGV